MNHYKFNNYFTSNSSATVFAQENNEIVKVQEITTELNANYADVHHHQH